MNRPSIRPLCGVLLTACFVASGAIAQDIGKATPAMRTLPGADQAKTAEVAKRLVGTWGIERPSEDKETNEVVTTLVELRADGSYATRVRSSVFKDQEKQPLASGRYSVLEGDGKGFTLVFERAAGDPEEGKESAVTRLSVSMVDDNTLIAADGSTVRRTR